MAEEQALELNVRYPHDPPRLRREGLPSWGGSVWPFDCPVAATTCRAMDIETFEPVCSEPLAHCLHLLTATGRRVLTGLCERHTAEVRGWPGPVMVERMHSV